MTKEKQNDKLSYNERLERIEKLEEDKAELIDLIPEIFKYMKDMEEGIEAYRGDSLTFEQLEEKKDLPEFYFKLKALVNEKTETTKGEI